MDYAINMSAEDRALIEEIQKRIENIREHIYLIEEKADLKDLLQSRIVSLKACSNYLNRKMVSIYNKYLQKMNKVDLSQLECVQEMFENAYKELNRRLAKIESDYQEKSSNFIQSDRYQNGIIEETSVKALKKFCEYGNGHIVSENQLSVEDICMSFLEDEKLQEMYLADLEDPALKEEVRKAIGLYKFYLANTDKFDKTKFIRALRCKANGFYTLANTTLTKQLDKILLQTLDQYQFPENVKVVLENMQRDGVYPHLESLKATLIESEALQQELAALKSDYREAQKVETEKSMSYLESIKNPEYLKKQVINYYAKQKGVNEPEYTNNFIEENLMLQYTQHVRDNKNFEPNLEKVLATLQKMLEQELSLEDCNARYTEWKKRYLQEMEQAKIQMESGNQVIETTTELSDLEKKIDLTTQKLKNILQTEKERIYQTRVNMEEQNEIKNLEVRKKEIKELLSEKGVITPILERDIDACKTSKELENVYRPFQGKKEKFFKRFNIKKIAKKVSSWYTKKALELLKRKREIRLEQCKQFVITEKPNILNIDTNIEDENKNTLEQFMDNWVKKRKEGKIFTSEEEKNRFIDCLRELTELKHEKSNKNTIVKHQSKKLNTLKSSTDNSKDIEIIDLDILIEQPDEDTARIRQNQVNLLRKFNQVNSLLTNISLEPEIGNAYQENITKTVENFAVDNSNGTMIKTEGLEQWGNDVGRKYKQWQLQSKKSIQSLDEQVKQNVDAYTLHLLDLYNYSNLNTEQRLKTVFEIQRFISRLKVISQKDDMSKMSNTELKLLLSLCYNYNDPATRERDRILSRRKYQCA